MATPAEYRALAAQRDCPGLARIQFRTGVRLIIPSSATHRRNSA
jgi:hypothetical protein